MLDRYGFYFFDKTCKYKRLNEQLTLLLVAQSQVRGGFLYTFSLFKERVLHLGSSHHTLKIRIAAEKNDHNIRIASAISQLVTSCI